MKKSDHFLVIMILASFFSAITSCSKEPEVLIKGKWELTSVTSNDSAGSILILAFYSDLTGMIMEFKHDSVMKVSLSKVRSKDSKLTSSFDKYYLIKEGEKNVMVQIEKDREEKFEILELNADSLHFKSQNSFFKFVRIK